MHDQSPRRGVDTHRRMTRTRERERTRCIESCNRRRYRRAHRGAIATRYEWWERGAQEHPDQHEHDEDFDERQAGAMHGALYIARHCKSPYDPAPHHSHAALHILTQLEIAMRKRHVRPLRSLTVILGVTFAAGCMPSRSELELMQSVNDLGDAVNALRQDNGVLLDQMDSLRLVIAKHDTLLRTLANLAGVAVPSGP